MAKFVWNASVFEDSPLYPASTATEVSVYDAETDTLAQIWEDYDGNSVKANPFTLTTSGKLQFYANEGRYNIVAQNGGETDTWDDELIGPTGGGGGGGGGAEFTIGAVITASGSMSDSDDGLYRRVTGSATIVWSVPSGLTPGVIMYVKVDKTFSGTFTIAAGSGTPTVDEPYGKTLVVPAGGGVSIVVYASGQIDVFGDGVAA